MLISFFDANGIVHKKFVPPGQTVNELFYLKVLKRLCDGVWKKDQKCGASVIGSFTTTIPPPTRPWVCGSFWPKKHDGYPSSTLFTQPWAMWHFPVPSYERPDERETFADVSEVKKKMLEVFPTSAWKSSRNVFSSGKNVGTSVLSQKESILKKTRVVIL